MMFYYFPYLQFLDLWTRYTALVTHMRQYVKFVGDSLKRLEEEEVTIIHEQATKKKLQYVWEKTKNGSMIDLHG